METPGKKPKKSMYYKMMRKAGLKKKMETDPTQWAQETPAPPSKKGAKYMAMGDVVRTEGHGGGVAADGPVAAINPRRRRDSENRKSAEAQTAFALRGIIAVSLVAFVAAATKDPVGVASVVHAALDKSRTAMAVCALAAVSTRPRLGFIIVVAVAAWTIAAHALHLPGLHDMSVLTNLVPPAVWDSSLVGFVKLALLGDHK
ncbi:predicted protein [Micromonas commoda]|uniref:Uncharacterized protein n=1 Tax=Micromonas commoda (strain RCC299 / NOUM17 / CCMP2709) TaxID=296587 RepID=C1EJG2_MICCC|nr:predicted protein [Micromonas commoda]ACO68034.1 predicted protein [Micromonas commoda]|eukprot:XP_002506776.1 predicted protein [Micromonas commoda]